MLKVTGAAEKAVWALQRACQSSGVRHLRAVAEGLLDALRPVAKELPDLERQLGLWLELEKAAVPWRELPQAERLFPDPPLYPEDRFDCARLDCTNMRVGACVSRQVTSENQRTTDLERGQSPSYPNCQSHLCDQGRNIRERLIPTAEIRYQPGAGATGRGERGREGAGEAMREAIDRLSAVGLLEPVPSMDEPPPEGDETED